MALEAAELVDELVETEEEAEADVALEGLWEPAALPDIDVSPGLPAELREKPMTLVPGTTVELRVAEAVATPPMLVGGWCSSCCRCVGAVSAVVGAGVPGSEWASGLAPRGDVPSTNMPPRDSIVLCCEPPL